MRPAVFPLQSKRIGAVRRASLVDVVALASVALRGGVVYTLDVDDLTRLQRYFQTGRIFCFEKT